MKKFLLILCAALCLTSGAEAKKKRKQPVAAPTAVQPVTNKGLFNVVRNGADWFFEIPDSLIGRRFLVTVRYTSTPGGTDKYGGELVNQQTVYWQKAPNDQLLLRSELLINAADSVDAINRAVISSNENPIIGFLSYWPLVKLRTPVLKLKQSSNSRSGHFRPLPAKLLCVPFRHARFTVFFYFNCKVTPREAKYKVKPDFSLLIYTCFYISAIFPCPPFSEGKILKAAIRGTMG